MPPFTLNAFFNFHQPVRCFLIVGHRRFVLPVRYHHFRFFLFPGPRNVSSVPVVSLVVAERQFGYREMVPKSVCCCPLMPNGSFNHSRSFSGRGDCWGGSIVGGGRTVQPSRFTGVGKRVVDSALLGVLVFCGKTETFPLRFRRLRTHLLPL